ncbi:MTRF1L release factor glutamine methyltransferase isoform X1 [Atheta coriaria]|uniref:MTRF1L release factor glutamine methyltransferase isoform X1 n=2 Tax=Dalotia coriaria TaxID=877792 RepID=UPI0031F38C98
MMLRSLLGSACKTNASRTHFLAALSRFSFFSSFAANPRLHNHMLSPNRSRQPNELNDSNQRGLYFSTAEFNSTVEESLQKWCKIFTNRKISEPLESIANILASVLKTNNLGEVYKHRKLVLSDLQVQNVNAMCEKRLQQMPVQYIIGEWDFRDINLKLRPPVFIPRPETEMLVEIALQDIKTRNVERVLELCCGSGAISCSLLHAVKNLSAVTIDISPDACRLCAENAHILSLTDRMQIENCAVKDFSSDDMFDVIISNPPYVLTGDMKDLQPEILLYEDVEALDGGADGLDVVKQIFTLASRHLNPSGSLFLEVDLSHPRLIRDLLADGGEDLTLLATHEDLAGETRFVQIIKKQETST